MTYDRIVTGGRHRYGPTRGLRCQGAEGPLAAVSPRRGRRAPDVPILAVFPSPYSTTQKTTNRLTPLDGTQPPVAETLDQRGQQEIRRAHVFAATCQVGSAFR